MKKKPPSKPDSPIRRKFLEAVKRASPDVITPAFRYLFERSRYKVNYGGRGAGRSWNHARALILRAHEKKLRILCTREIQASITESVHRLLADQIALLGLSDFFEIQQYGIYGANGSEFIFEGLRANQAKIKSLEGIDICWVEEAEAISDYSWSVLIPTIRKRGSEIWITFNPNLETDPTYQRFVVNPPPNSIVKKTTWLDNPHFPPELEAERAYLESVDDDAYRWIWLGECRSVSDAQVLKGKYSVQPITIDPRWSGPYFGIDFGFSNDPSAGICLYVDDLTRAVYVTSEFWGLKVDIDALPSALTAALPGVEHHVAFCDSSRPESISYLQKHGLPNARAADKWGGSVQDGVAYLRSFTKIVVAPECKKFLDECRLYSFKTDRLTGLPLPELEDRNNHLIDAARYALSPLIRKVPSTGFFDRRALLVKGEPVEPTIYAGRPKRIYMTMSTCDRPGTGVALITWVHSPHHGFPLFVADYDLVEIGTTLDWSWISGAFDRAQEIRAEWRVVDPLVVLWIDAGELHEAVSSIASANVETLLASGFPMMDVMRVDAGRLPATLDERTDAIRATINGGQFVKLSKGAVDRQRTFRSTLTNQLTAALLSYRPGQRDTDQELVAAFALGALVARAPEWRPAPAMPAEIPAEAAQDAPRAAIAPPPLPTIMIAPGTHWIDGEAVEVPGDGDRALVEFALPPGRHQIDGKITIVTRPIRIRMV